MAIHFNKSTFIHIPKNAGNSLKVWLKEHQAEYDDQENHCTLTQAKSIWPDLGTTFAFVRNPYSRTVSMFQYIGQHAERRILEKKSTNLVEDLRTVSIYKKGFDYWLNCLYDLTSEFPEHTSIATVHGISTWPRRAPQSLWLEGLDVAIKIEELDSKLSQIEELTGCKSRSSFKIINSSNHTDYRTYYNEQNKKIVTTMFAQDFENYGYDF